MDKTTILPNRTQYHAGGAGMMGNPSSPIEFGSITVSIFSTQLLDFCISMMWDIASNRYLLLQFGDCEY
tara:strand:- start:785 stop:991 length:207 start_codon:yes stop_codon:yes gene_type:complete